MAGLSGGLSPNAIKTALDKVFNSRFSVQATPGYALPTDEMVFRQMEATNSAVISEQFQGVGNYEERAERQDVPEASPRIGNQQTTTIVNLSKSVAISKNFFDDDQHNIVQKMIESAGMRARTTREQRGFGVYRNGFSTQLANDGVALFSNSHVTLGGQTVDNLETGALSVSNLETAVVSLSEQITQDGDLGGHMPNCLLVPPALFKEATELTESELIPDSGNHAVNWISRIFGLQVKMNPYLGASQGGSNTAWFLLGRDHFIHRYRRQDLVTDLVDYKYQKNNDYIYKTEFREEYDSVSYEGSIGSNGTT